jgi:hypothetical protein
MRVQGCHPALAELVESALPDPLEVDVVGPLSNELGTNKPEGQKCECRVQERSRYLYVYKYVDT